MTYLLAGLLVSLIGTFGVRFIADKQNVAAAVAGWLSMFVSLYVILDIMQSLGGVWSISLYATGFAIGTYVASSYNRS